MQTPEKQSNVIEITSKQQLNQLLQQYPVVILDIYGTYCGPCKAMKSTYESMADKYTSQQVVFTYLNVETNIISNVKGVPTLQVFHNGNMIEEILGADIPALQKAISTLVPEPQPVTFKTEQQIIQPQTLQFKNKPNDRKSSMYKTYGHFK